MKFCENETIEQETAKFEKGQDFSTEYSEQAQAELDSQEEELSSMKQEEDYIEEMAFQTLMQVTDAPMSVAPMSVAPMSVAPMRAGAESWCG